MKHASQKVKILVCGVLPPPRFGHSVMYEMLMMSQFPKEFEVSFINLHFWSYKNKNKVTITKMVKLIAYLFQYVYQLIFYRPKYVLYNISFYPMPFLKDFLFCSLGIVMGSRVVLHDHGQYVNELYQTMSPIKKKMLRWLLDHICASILMGQRTKREYDGLIDSSKLFIGEGGIDDLCGNNLGDVPSGDRLKVLYFSHLSYDKGADLAFEAAHRLLSLHTDIEFHFAGPMVEEPIIDQYTLLKKKYHDRVFDYGYVDDDETKVMLFSQSDIFIFPTRRDVFGLVLLDAMAFGMPIVAADEGNIGGILPEDQLDFMFERGNVDELTAKVAFLIKDKEKRRLLSEKNRNHFLSKYTIQEYGGRMVQIFKKLDQTL